ncbi:MAG: hypothetical protein R3C60_11260 [Parvularculaceae bacterium]
MRIIILFVACLLLASCWTSKTDLLSDRPGAKPTMHSGDIFVRLGDKRYLLEENPDDDDYLLYNPEGAVFPVKFAKVSGSLFSLGAQRYIVSYKNKGNEYSYVLISRETHGSWIAWRPAAANTSDLGLVRSWSELASLSRTAVKGGALKPYQDFNIFEADPEDIRTYKQHERYKFEAEQTAKAEKAAAAERAVEEAAAKAERARQAAQSKRQNSISTAGLKAPTALDVAPTPAEMRAAMQRSSLGITVDSVQRIQCGREKIRVYICNYRVRARLNSNDSISQFASSLTGIGVNQGRFWKVGGVWYFKRIDHD